ncbi:P-loop containing nucleoside triphosphate hydrolase protein, partial [Phlebopus sp. FC_14]
SRRAQNRTSSASTSAAPPNDSDPEFDIDLNTSSYARMRKELMQLINDLRSMGADVLIDLPTVVVIGGQSAGKSSLVEAVSGINVPRDSGTCTRCPMECTMSSSATSWSCKISLRTDYDTRGHPLPNSTRVTFGPTITDRNSVELWLRRAQAAILNPNTPQEQFHQKTLNELRSLNGRSELKFSRNVVSIAIEDPDVTDLSFVDVPGKLIISTLPCRSLIGMSGLIQNEDQEVIDLVRNLVVEYIGRPNTIILTTIPMSDDMENQLSVRLAREADPDGERTIGVLTKPDTIGEGAINARQRWIDVIEGREHHLRHGYYCVRLPDDAQRAQNLSRAAMQTIAAQFFETTPPWSEVADRRRFGISGFVADISNLLIRFIERALPSLRQKVEQLLTNCLAELDALPPPLTTDPQIEVLERVNAFCNAFKGAVNGTSSDKSLAQRNRALYSILKKDIRGTAPDFRPFEDPEAYNPIDNLDSDRTLTNRDPSVTMMGLLEVRMTIQECMAWELPNNTPYEAKTRLISGFTGLWRAPAVRCLTAIGDVLEEVVENLIKLHFGRFVNLENLTRRLVRADLDEFKGQAHDAVSETLQLELNPNFTQNTHYYQTLCEGWLNKYKLARQDMRVHEIDYTPPRVRHVRVDNESPDVVALRALAQLGYGGLSVNDLARLLPPDARFEQELIVMADVRAYFHVAYKRIIDHIPLKIEHALHHALADKLSVSLLQNLVVNGDSADRMRELVSEDPAIAKRRANLQAKKDRLMDIRRRLMAF